jgi:hypothetical protein
MDVSMGGIAGLYRTMTPGQWTLNEDSHAGGYETFSLDTVQWNIRFVDPFYVWTVVSKRSYFWIRTTVR